MKTSYRRRAILNRIHNALDAFYLLQKIDWEYDIRTTLDKILAIALEEIDLGEGRKIDRALLIIKSSDVDTLEIHAGWRVEEFDLSFSRTVVQQAIEDGEPVLCENAKEDPRFHEAESLKALSTLSLICVPIKLVDRVIGALYIESPSPTNILSEEDLDFLQDFTNTIAPYLKTALLHQGHVQEIQRLRVEIQNRYGFDNIMGRSDAIRGVFEMIRIASTVDRTALITGESGCGKELVARAIHYSSPRKKGPLVTVDCSGLADHLLESELFGHIIGAFTGASTDKMGAFEEANGGTIFLDEISDAPKPLQQLLRRVLQEGEIRRVGENHFHKVDVRIICATNKSLPDLVESGEFTRDLYYRINKIPIHIPPLRERREDIPPLIHHFLANSSQESNGSNFQMTEDGVEMLARLDWVENNVRELRNVVELAIDLSSGNTIDRDAIERVLRIQRGEPIKPLLGESVSPLDSEKAKSVEPKNLVHIHRQAFQGLLKRSQSESGEDSSPSDDKNKTTDKKATPFYLIQQELATRAIIEGLRSTNWKLRPAARLLGISPMKLRGTLRESLSDILKEQNGDLAQAAEILEIPLEILQKKAGDLGLEEVTS